MESQTNEPISQKPIRIEDVTTELCICFHALYGVRLCLNTAHALKDSNAYNQKWHDCSESLERDCKHSAIAFKLLQLFITSLKKCDKEMRNEINRVLTLIYNAFREIPTPCKSISSGSFLI